MGGARLIALMIVAWSTGAWADDETPVKHGKRTRNRYFKGRVATVLQKEPLSRPSGTLDIENINNGERLFVNIFNPDGTYNATSLDQLNHLWRCRRTNHERSIEPALFEVLSHVYDKFGQPIQLYSGHRMNSESYHYKGSASDIHIDKVPLVKLRQFVESLDTGGMGVGIYPRSGFIHVDIRPPPSYRWVDRSPPGGRRRASKKPVS